MDVSSGELMGALAQRVMRTRRPAALQRRKSRALGVLRQGATGRRFESLGGEGRREQGSGPVPLAPSLAPSPTLLLCSVLRAGQPEAAPVKGLPCCSVHGRESQPGFGERGDVRGEVCFRNRS